MLSMVLCCWRIPILPPLLGFSAAFTLPMLSCQLVNSYYAGFFFAPLCRPQCCLVYHSNVPAFLPPSGSPSIPISAFLPPLCMVSMLCCCSTLRCWLFSNRCRPSFLCLFGVLILCTRYYAFRFHAVVYTVTWCSGYGWHILPLCSTRA